LRGTTQNDILKEYIAQKCWCFPPRPSLRIIVDGIEFATKHVPQWNTISISGYHIREAGSTAAQELAFTIADGFTYVEACLERGLRGARRRARRHAVAAQELDGRDDRAAERQGRQDSAAHAAGHRARDRRHRDDRSAGGLVLSREPDEHARGASREVFRPDRG